MKISVLNSGSIFFCVFALLFTISSGVCALNMDEVIRQKVELARFQETFVFNDKLVCQQSLFRFYSAREFAPAWNNDKDVEELVKLLELADDHGLQREDYHYITIRNLWEKNKDRLIIRSAQADFDVLLTDAYLLFAGHMLSGKVDPKDFDTNWFAVKNEGFPSEKLNSALESGVLRSMKELVPQDKNYEELVDYLKKYRMIRENGGWKNISVTAKKIEKRYEGTEIPLIKQRLKLTGDYAGRIDSLFDDSLEDAVKQFQKRNGLKADGVIGAQTVDVMNIPVEKRIDQIVTNLERFRWLTRDLGEDYILVNIANYEMNLYEHRQPVLQKKVMVGKTYRKTPVFSSRLSYVVINPTWTVPPTILNTDILPAQRKDPSAIAKKHLKVIGSDGREIDPSSINWAQYPGKPFPYQLRQDPGPENALGAVKFIFPNQFNVYLHDTPHKELFDNPERALSSGCIRVEKPLELAEVVLDQNTGWNRERIDQVVETRKTETIFPKKAINVHLQYFTTWVNDEGELNFRKDIYERDALVFNALNAHLPSIDLSDDLRR